MLAISKRYSRLIIYCVVVVSIILLGVRYQPLSSIGFLGTEDQYVADELNDNVEIVWSKEEIVGLLAANRIDMDSKIDAMKLDLNKLLITNVGLKDCSHIATKFEHCYVKAHSKLPIDALKEQKLEVTVGKDIKGSFGFNWYGHSEYLFYDVVTLDSLLQIKIDKIYVLTSITEAKETGDKLVSYLLHDLNFNFEEISLKHLFQQSSESHVISDLNVLFGRDCKDPRDGWNLYKEKPLSQDFRYPSYLSYKKIPILNQTEDNLESNKKLYFTKGAFKIIQLADLHMGVGENECVDEYPTTESCHADPKTFDFINKVLDIEEPDLVVFTGDQIMGDRSVQDSESTLLKVVEPVIKRKIPWAMVWGNHDDEGSLSRWELSELASTLPYSLFQFSPFDTKDNSFGVGNYIHQVYNKSDPTDVLMTFYFLDSHKYSKAGKIYPGYDWIKEDQWAYIKNVYENDLYKNIPTDKPHVSMAFFHIPLPEYLNIASKKHPGERNQIVGNFKEGVTAPKYNSGGLEVLNQLGVEVTSCGHDHCNDYCLKDDTESNPVWLCFGGGAGEGGYAGYGGTERRIRTYEINPYNGNIYTWKRLNGSPDKSFDYQQL